MNDHIPPILQAALAPFAPKRITSADVKTPRIVKVLGADPRLPANAVPEPGEFAHDEAAAIAADLDMPAAKFRHRERVEAEARQRELDQMVRDGRLK